MDVPRNMLDNMEGDLDRISSLLASTSEDGADGGAGE